MVIEDEGTRKEKSLRSSRLFPTNCYSLYLLNQFSRAYTSATMSFDLYVQHPILSVLSSLIPTSSPPPSQRFL
jgi:hypothetical protein